MDIGENRIANTTIVLIMFKSPFHKRHTLFTRDLQNSCDQRNKCVGIDCFLLENSKEVTIRSDKQTTSSVRNGKVIRMSTLSLQQTEETAKYPQWEGLRDSTGVLENRKYRPKSAYRA